MKLRRQYKWIIVMRKIMNWILNIANLLLLKIFLKNYAIKLYPFKFLLISVNQNKVKIVKNLENILIKKQITKMIWSILNIFQFAAMVMYKSIMDKLPIILIMIIVKIWKTIPILLKNKIITIFRKFRNSSNKIKF